MKGQYTGEMNSNGEAHGWGKFEGEDGSVIEGTFVHNSAEGFCK